MIFSLRNKINNISSDFKLIMHRKKLSVLGKTINNGKEKSITMHRSNKTWAPNINM